MQTNNRIFDDLAKVLTSAAGAAGGVRAEVEAAVRIQLERIVADMDLVSRDEFEAVKAIAVAARDEAQALQTRVLELEQALGAKALEAVEKKGKSGSGTGSKSAKLRQSSESKGDD